MSSEALTALILKLFMTFLFGVATFTYVDNNTWAQVFWVALGVTVMNYLVGDRMVLPALGNIVASVGDGVLGVVVALLSSALMPAFNATALSIILFGVLLIAGEHFFHQYLMNTDPYFRPQDRATDRPI